MIEKQGEKEGGKEKYRQWTSPPDHPFTRKPAKVALESLKRCNQSGGQDE
ncbi:hypothetical protein ACFOTA_11635 [Chitinophaga sp. GCM10012297]|uniref:Uncharacterized protein n=1 Tax=Chitinophaga chungangae TaxID=2821488 RepID=A0ABS3YDU7_9BACT|nr:hypothetical protein [Chitinophaga chungangae]MBO9152862.1 hypothetical protein [Chitinophaga chungangae]